MSTTDVFLEQALDELEQLRTENETLRAENERLWRFYFNAQKIVKEMRRIIGEDKND